MVIIQLFIKDAYGVSTLARGCQCLVLSDESLNKEAGVASAL